MGGRGEGEREEEREREGGRGGCSGGQTVIPHVGGISEHASRLFLKIGKGFERPVELTCMHARAHTRIRTNAKKVHPPPAKDTHRPIAVSRGT